MEDCLELLQRRAEGRGDLPVFRASVLQVVRLGEDPRCAASDIARIILQDQGFSVKVLRIANTAYYNRTDQLIKTISRAVVLLGVEVVREISLGLGFVEVFQQHHPGIDLRRILARSYFAAVLAREISRLSREPKGEEAFLAGLLQYLGPLAVAFYLPEKFLAVEQVRQKRRCSAEAAEKEVLGRPVLEFGEFLAAKWTLPGSVARCLEECRPEAEDPDRRLAFLARASRRLTENLFGEGRKSPSEFKETVASLREILEVDSEEAMGAIEAAYTEARRSAGHWGVDVRMLTPAATENGEPVEAARQKAVGLLGQVIRREGLADEPFASGESESRDKASLQLDLLREISTHIFENRDLSTLFDLVMEGIQKVAEFDRIVLALCNTERTWVTGKYGFGTQANELAAAVNLNLEAENLFTRCMKERRAMLVPDAEQDPFLGQLPGALRTIFQARSFVVSPLFSAEKLVGLLYADNHFSGRSITVEAFRCFEHFTQQANLGLDRHRLRL